MRPIVLLVASEVSAPARWRQSLGIECELVETSAAAGIGAWVKASRSAVMVVRFEENHEGILAAARIRQICLGLPIVLVVGHGSEQLAVSAFRAGITDYFHVPEEEGAMLAAVRRLMAVRADSLRTLESLSPQDWQFAFVGSSETLRNLQAQVERIAESSSNVLITGETGTGKELVATAIYRRSVRNHQPFVRVNCAAIPDALVESEWFGYERGAFTGAHIRNTGWLEAADKGTMFLDEVGDMSPHTQAKLLRVIESKAFRRLGGKTEIKADVRFIAATNRNLEEMIAHGEFRRDLYYRLNIARVHLRPLRDRREDIPVLLQHYVRELNSQTRRHITDIAPDVWDRLLQYDWPGNIRELKNVLEAAFVNASNETMSMVDLPDQLRSFVLPVAGSLPDERQQLLRALLETRWNKSKAAEQLRWSRMTLYRKMRKYQIASPASDPVGSSKAASA